MCGASAGGILAAMLRSLPLALLHVAVLMAPATLAVVPHLQCEGADRLPDRRLTRLRAGTAATAAPGARATPRRAP
jgi:hypothetical protein